MADNVAITAGSGTTIAADDVAGVMHQRVKLSLGADGSAVDAVGGAGAVGSSTQRVIHAGLEYETVAASQTDQVLGATGATGDFLSHIVIQPTTTGAGTVTVKDNTTVIFTFTTGTLSDLRPITVPFNAISTAGAWKVTTGANVAVIGFGDFT